MAITVYLLYHGGKWLDIRFGTAPLFSFIGILLAIAAVFKRLFTDIRMMEKDPSQNKEDE